LRLTGKSRGQAPAGFASVGGGDGNMNESDLQAVRKMEVFGRTLEKRSKLLSEFLNEHSLGEPKSVEYRPLAGFESCNCFRNVETQIKRAGGAIETGWAFRELIGISIHTIAHAIWITPQGRRVDITPWQYAPERRVLFLPDSRVAIKRGYTAGFRSIYTKDERLRAIEVFEDALEKIYDEFFVKMGDYMDVPESKFIEAANRAGIPWAIAQGRVKESLQNFGH
jgi:hypothetical protein